MAAKISGSLTVAGSGIASIGHITLETLGHIKEADIIHYAVTDPATECYIQENSRGKHSDLTRFYDTNKKRYESYVQMSEVMLRDVRAGLNVLGIFYGHPGVFVAPSHRAIAIAREEGFQAKMLPGVSAEDYMFADLGFDPSTYGCMTQEATELLVRNKTLNPAIHNIIWQVGSVGVDTMVFDNAQFHLLVDRLEKDFGPDHSIVHYIGAILPQSVTVKDKFAIRDLRKEDVLKQFTTTSTFYVPPRAPAPVDAKMAQALGIPTAQSQRQPQGYGPEEKQAVAAIDSFVASAERPVPRTSRAMQSFMVDLALQPKLLAQYKADPVAIANARNGLTAQERYALGLNKPGPVLAVTRDLPSVIASGKKKTNEEIAHAVDTPSSLHHYHDTAGFDC